jgi:hypothetical protein
MAIRTAILLIFAALLPQGILAAPPRARQGPSEPHTEPYKCIDAGMVVYSDAPCTSATGGTSADLAGVRLTREQVVHLVDSFDRSAGHQDWNALAGYVADDAVIQIQRSPSRGGHSAMGKAEYRRLLSENSHKMRNYALHRENVQVEVHPDGYRAQVDSKLTQYWLDPGGALMVTSQETWVVEPRGGRLRIVIMDILERDPKPQPPR